MIEARRTDGPAPPRVSASDVERGPQPARLPPLVPPSQGGPVDFAPPPARPLSGDPTEPTDTGRDSQPPGLPSDWRDGVEIGRVIGRCESKAAALVDGARRLRAEVEAMRDLRDLEESWL